MARGTQVDLKNDPGEKMIDKRTAQVPGSKPKPQRKASSQAAALEGY